MSDGAPKIPILLLRGGFFEDNRKRLLCSVGTGWGHGRRKINYLGFRTTLNPREPKKGSS